MTDHRFGFARLLLAPQFPDRVRSVTSPARRSGVRSLAGIAAAAVVSATLAAPPPRGGPGGPPPGGPGGPFRSDISPQSPTLRDLYPPEQVLENQVALGMTDDQLDALKKLLQETHTATLDAQFTLQRNVEALRAALQSSRVDEAAALAAADRVMQLESATKRTHLSMLIRIKNLLTADQQKKLDALDRPLRGERRE